MANEGKTIAQYAELSALNTTDALLVQRNNQYYKVLGASLTTGAQISDTYANTVILAGAGNLKAGAVYYLSDKYIYVTAINTTTFGLNGVFYGRNADYQGVGSYSGVTVANGFTVTATGTNLGVWTSALTPASGDAVIWNGLHYLNITGSNGASNPPADAVNWELIPNTDITLVEDYGYIVQLDAIEYDFGNDSIIRRLDARSNDVAENSIATFQWGNDNVVNNTIIGEATVTITNILGNFQGNTLAGDLEVVADTGSTTFSGISIPYYVGGVKTYLHDYTGYFLRGCVITAIDNIYIYSVENGGQRTIELRNSNFEYTVELTATAYSGATTYNYGDFVTSGTVTYMYINQTGSAGNAPPNATYWQEVFDATTAGRHKLTISKYFNASGTYILQSTNATETIDEIVYDGFAPDRLYNKFETDGVDVTFDNTAVGSLANTGEIVAPGNVVVESGKGEFAVFEGAVVSATTVQRIVIDQTSNA